MATWEEVRRGTRRQARPRQSYYPQWGMETPKLVSTGRYRGDTGNLLDFYLIKPRGGWAFSYGMTIEDALEVLAAAVSVAIIAYALGPGMDRCIEVLGW